MEALIIKNYSYMPLMALVSPSSTNDESLDNPAKVYRVAVTQ